MRTKCERAFTPVEVIASLLIVSLLFAMLAVAGGESRRVARLGEDVAKLRQIGAWTGCYAADNSDLYWTYSWKKGQQLSQWPDLNQQALISTVQANTAQAVDILRRLAGREDIPAAVGIVPQLNYNHLVLLEFLAGRFPDTAFVSSADTNRLKWARDPRGFDAGLYQPVPSNWGDPQSRRWPYSASFRTPSAFYDLSPPGTGVIQYTYHQYLVAGNYASTGGRLLSEVAFPSAKVQMYDQNARHFGARQPFGTHDEARPTTLGADGSVLVRASAGSNPGWNPSSPASLTPTSFAYLPDAWEPATMSGASTDVVIGRFVWTRGGLGGRDFGGPEVCTGQPGCP